MLLRVGLEPPDEGVRLHEVQVPRHMTSLHLRAVARVAHHRPRHRLPLTAPARLVAAAAAAAPPALPALPGIQVRFGTEQVSKIRSRKASHRFWNH